MEKRFLITTALEETWRDDAPVLFLGEWCRRYDRQDAWQGLDAAVLPYHWDDRGKLHRDYLYLQALYETMLGELAEQLNEMHGVRRSVRYWRILVGPWLGYFLQVLFDRWAVVRQALAEYEVCGARVIAGPGHPLVPNDMDGFQVAFVTDGWNESIWGELLERLGVPVEFVPGAAQASLPRTVYVWKSPAVKLKIAVSRVVSALSGIVCRPDEYFLISSYLPTRLALSLQWKLGQIPKYWQSAPVPLVPADHNRRKERAANFSGDDFPSLARAMVQRHIPTAYVEGYRQLLEAPAKLRWPRRPRAIFTANAYASDDVFKAWAADKVEAGTPLVIGQHGGVFGTAGWMFIEEHQIAIADRFLTWGWRQEGCERVVPFGDLKDIGRSQTTDPGGAALMVGMTVPRTSYHLYSLPIASQWLRYFDEQCRFVEALPPALRSQLLIRLYPQDYAWCQRRRWLDRFPAIRLDAGQEPITSVIAKSRLYISTYNATTYLESLTLDIPTIIFWNPEYYELREAAIPAFELLKAVGIFHETPESAAAHMANVWNDVDAWWQSDATQRARREFCQGYARIPERPADTLAEIFRQAGNDAARSRPA
ncbi:MAG: LIC12162 family transferase [Ignavibacteria bacterium]